MAGYSYKDKYGISHVVSDQSTAQQYAAPGSSVDTYSGKSGGGYALDSNNKPIDASTAQLALTPNQPNNANLSNSGLIANLQQQASNIYAQTGDWNDPQITALHNQVVALKGGTGEVYTPSTGAWGLPSLTPAPTQQPDQLTQIMELMNKIQTQQVQAPVYQQPNYSSLIPAPQQGPAATANAAETYFVPTARYNDRVQQARQAADTNAYNSFNADLATYNARQGAQQQQLSNMVSLLPMTTLTAGEKAKAAVDAQIAANKSTETAYTQAFNRWVTRGEVANESDAQILGVPVGTKTDDATYREASLAVAAAKSSGGGSGSGGPSATDYTNIRWADEQARKRAAEDARLWDEGGTLKWLTDAYVGAGYDAGTAEAMAKADERYKPSEGQVSSGDLYNSYLRDMYRQLGYMP